MTSTMTNRRRSSAANVLDQTPRKRILPTDNNNVAKQLIVTTNGNSFDLSPIPTPICQTPIMGVGFQNGAAWRGDCISTGSAFTFVQYES